MTDEVERPYNIEGRERVLHADGLRVQVLTLGPGEVVPWHYHSTIADIFVAVEGRVVVETPAPCARHELAPGEHCVVPAKTAHMVTGAADDRCRFTIVQGVGKYDYVPIGGPS